MKKTETGPSGLICLHKTLQYVKVEVNIILLVYTKIFKKFGGCHFNVIFPEHAFLLVTAIKCYVGLQYVHFSIPVALRIISYSLLPTGKKKKEEE